MEENKNVVNEAVDNIVEGIGKLAKTGIKSMIEKRKIKKIEKEKDQEKDQEKEKKEDKIKSKT